MEKNRVEIDPERGVGDIGWKRGLREMPESEVHIYLDRFWLHNCRLHQKKKQTNKTVSYINELTFIICILSYVSFIKTKTCK